MNIPDLLPGDEIKYRRRKGLKKIYDKIGTIIQDAGKFWVINLGNYRDTLLKNDLITGEIVILEHKKGVETMHNPLKFEVPAKEVLQDLFNRASGNISSAGKMYDPPVSDVTMRKWLREVGIITKGVPKQSRVCPEADVLRKSWEEGKRTLNAVAKKHKISGVTAKRWLKERGIITEGPTGITTVEATLEQSKDASTMEENSSSNTNISEIINTIICLSDTLNSAITKQGMLIDRLTALEKTVATNICNPDDAADEERIKKLLDFCIAPMSGRVEKLECSLAAVAKIMINKDDAERYVESQARLNALAGLMVAALERI